MKKCLPRDGEGISVCFEAKNCANEVSAMRTAAIGIGSNSLRMLIADLQEGHLHRVERYRAGLRMFAALDEEGNISSEMIEKACSSVEHFKVTAMHEGAEIVHLFATSAVRDAANQEAFTQALYQATGLKLEICSGEEEASLSFWGAAGSQPCGLIDIGGGSTEIAIGYLHRIDCSTSLQMGAVRLYRQQPIASLEDAKIVFQTALQILAPHKQSFAQFPKEEWIGVGGTFTTCAALLQRIPWQEKDRIHGYIITRKALEEAIAYLAPLPLEERLKLPFLQPQRADIVVHGMVILLACMADLKIDAMTVSECGNLEGYLKAKYMFNAKI